ncbi:MAG: hypothetical protein EBV20_11680 [Betaproteobacteria bacterium]|jgi:hypothetical protein|nr:hypothetical protein [Betaproteobacteria bacterium]NBP45534.1 hypothetical protein [Betaproteobacteria bacterium]
MSFTSTQPFAVGDFQITPLSRSHGNDQHTALLSIRQGKGSQTRDRVYTFKPEFKTQDSALMYAAAQGRYWLLNPASLASPSNSR